MTFQELASSEFSQLLTAKIGSGPYKLWFEEQTRLEWNPPTLTVGVPNRHFVEWLSERYGKILGSVATELAGEHANVVIRIDQELFRQMRAKQKDAVLLQPQSASPTPKPLKSLDTQQTKTSPDKRAPRRLRNLEEFFPGNTNRSAWTAAMAVSQRLVSSGTVIFQGGNGTGKTHLLEGIAWAARKTGGGQRTLLLSVEEFIQKFLQNIRMGSMAGWRRWIRSHELFLLDDLHRLSGKQSTQEELLYFLDYLQRQGGVFVGTMGDPTKRESGLIPELADRLVAGLNPRLFAPDQEAKGCIFKQTLGSLEPILLAGEVTDWVGNHLQGSAREIQGAANTLWLAAKIAGSPIDMPLATETLGHLAQTTKAPKQLEDIEACVVSVLGIAPTALRGKSRDKRQSVPRFLAAYLARKHTTASATEIGIFLGGRSHSTVLGCDKKVKQWLEKGTESKDRPPGLEVLIARLEGSLQSGSQGHHPPLAL